MKKNSLRFLVFIGVCFGAELQAASQGAYKSASVTPFHWASNGQTYFLLGKQMQNGHPVWTDFSAERTQGDEQETKKQNAAPSLITAKRAAVEQATNLIQFNEPLLLHPFYLSVMGEFHLYPKIPSKPYQAAYFLPISHVETKAIADTEEKLGQKLKKIGWHWVNAKKILAWMREVPLGDLNYPGLDAPISASYKSFLLDADVQKYLEQIIGLGDKHKRMNFIFNKIKMLLDKNVDRPDWEDWDRNAPQDWHDLQYLRLAAYQTELSANDFLQAYLSDYETVKPLARKAFVQLITDLAPRLLTNGSLTQPELEALRKELDKIDSFGVQETKQALIEKIQVIQVELARRTKLEQQKKEAPKRGAATPKTPRRAAMTPKQGLTVRMREEFEPEQKGEQAFSTPKIPAGSKIKLAPPPPKIKSEEHEKNIMKNFRKEFLDALQQEDLERMEEINKKAGRAYARFKATPSDILENHLNSMLNLIDQIEQLREQAGQMPREMMQQMKEKVFKKAGIKIEEMTPEEQAERDRKEKRRYEQIVNKFYNALSKKEIKQMAAVLAEAEQEFALISALPLDQLADQLATMKEEFASVFKVEVNNPQLEYQQFEQAMSDFSKALSENDLKGMEAALVQAQQTFDLLTTIPQGQRDAVIAAFKKKIASIKK